MVLGEIWKSHGASAEAFEGANWCVQVCFLGLQQGRDSSWSRNIFENPAWISTGSLGVCSFGRSSGICKAVRIVAIMLTIVTWSFMWYADAQRLQMSADYPSGSWSSPCTLQNSFPVLWFLTHSPTGWWFGTFFIFPYIGNFIIPTD